MRRRAWMLIVVSALTFFVGLGRSAISDSDEAFYAEASREMVESGDWLTPRFNYELRFQKPVFYYWLAAAAYRVAGVSEGAARFPSALAALGLVLVTWGAGRRFTSPRAAYFAGLIVASNFGYYFIARLALPDLPLTLFIATATWAGLEAIRAYTAPRGTHPAAKRWLVLASAGAAFAVLTKGPVGLALPALVCACAAATAWRNDRGWPAWRVPLPHLALAAGVFVAVVAPWFLAMADEHGVGYLRQFFVGENLERFATERYNEPRPLLFYVPIVIGGLLPWSPLLALAVPRGIRWARRAQPLTRDQWWLVIWALVPLAFYSFSIGKQPRYVLPVLPPLAILLGTTLANRLDDARPARASVAWCTTVSGLVIVAIGAFLWRAAPILVHHPPGFTRLMAVVAAAAGLAVVLLAWTGRGGRIPAAVALGTSAAFLALHFAAFSAAGQEPVQRMARLYAEHHRAGMRTGTYRVFVRNLVFYTGVKQTDLDTQAALVRFLQSHDRVLCVITQEDLERLESATSLRPRRLASVQYFNPAGARLRTAFAPDPAKDLDTVFLIANRE